MIEQSVCDVCLYSCLHLIILPPQDKGLTNIYGLRQSFAMTPTVDLRQNNIKKSLKVLDPSDKILLSIDKCYKCKDLSELFPKTGHAKYKRQISEDYFDKYQ